MGSLVHKESPDGHTKENTCICSYVHSLLFVKGIRVYSTKLDVVIDHSVTTEMRKNGCNEKKAATAIELLL